MTLSHEQADPRNQSRSEWREGWRLLVPCFFGMFLAALPMNMLGVFMRPLSAEFGWSHGAMSVAVPLSGWAIALSAPFMGMLIDRYGVRPFGIAGAIALPCAIATLAFSSASITSYLVSWVLIALAQITASALIWTVPVAAHFRQNRGAALAIILIGSSVAGVCYSPIATVMIEHWGWRLAYAGTGLFALLLTLPLVLKFLHDPRNRSSISLASVKREPAARSHDPAQGLDLRQALRTRRLWQLLLAILFGAGSSLALFVQIVPISVSFGLPAFQAATVASLIGAGSIIAKLIVGPLIDRMRAGPLAAVTMLGPVVACTFMLSPGGFPYPLALVSGFLIGIATGAELDVIGVIVARHFGTAHYGKIYGIALSVFQVALGTGPLLMAIAFDWQGDYTIGLKVCMGLLLTSSVLFMAMGAELQPVIRKAITRPTM